jgi:hypothetical protein
LVRESVDLVQQIRSGFRASNEEAKRKLEERLSGLEESLKQAGALGWVAAAYSRMLESTSSLVQSCKRAQLFFRENLDTLAAGPADPDYLPNWRLVEVLFDAIAENREVPRRAMLDRIAWYDEKDRIQIEAALNAFNGAHDRATAFVQTKAAREVAQQLEIMGQSLEQVESALEATMYETVLQTLQQLRV